MAAVRRGKAVAKQILPQSLQRSAWKSAFRLPENIEKRRAKYLSQRTGPQLKRLCEHYFSNESTRAMNEVDDAFLRSWLYLSPRYAILRRILEESGFRDDLEGKVLTVGDGTAAVAALRQSLGTETRITTIEGTTPRTQLSNDLCGDKNTVFSQSLADAARLHNARKNFELIICAFHLSEVRDTVSCDATLAVLWGCLKPEGHLIVVEMAENEHYVQTARARLLNPKSHKDPADRATIIAPCPMDGRCPLLKRSELPIDQVIHDPERQRCFFAQAALHPKSGPALRSIRPFDAGRSMNRRNSIERFSYFVAQKKQRLNHQQPTARVMETPLKNVGHVIVDLCTAHGSLSRITIPRAAAKKHSDFSFSLARRITWGSNLFFSDDDQPSSPPLSSDEIYRENRSHYTFDDHDDNLEDDDDYDADDDPEDDDDDDDDYDDDDDDDEEDDYDDDHRDVDDDDDDDDDEEEATRRRR